MKKQSGLDFISHLIRQAREEQSQHKALCGSVAPEPASELGRLEHQPGAITNDTCRTEGRLLN
jgi:hypothetical protein